jgi:uncharacterized membrane protein YbhN (UPF0104 family)
VSAKWLATANATAPPRVLGLRWRPIALTVACVVVVLAVAMRLRTIEVAGFFGALRSAGVGAFAIGVLGGTVVVGLQALRWWVVTRPVLEVRYRDAFEALLVGGLVNALVPARAGDLLRVRYLGDRTGVSQATLLGTELIDFWTDKCGWLPAFALFALSGAPPAWMYRALALMGGLALVLLGGVVFVRRRMGRTGIAQGWRRRFAMGLAASSARRLALTAFGLAALPWLWEAFVLGRVASVAGVSLSVLQAFVVLTAFNVATVVPVPGSLGAYEAASSLVLASFGASVERAVALSLVYHASQLTPYALGGAFAAWRWRRVSPPP